MELELPASLITKLQSYSQQVRRAMSISQALNRHFGIREKQARSQVKEWSDSGKGELLAKTQKSLWLIAPDEDSA